MATTLCLEESNNDIEDRDNNLTDMNHFGTTQTQLLINSDTQNSSVVLK